MREAMIGPGFPEPVGCNLGVVAEALFALTKCRFRLPAVFYICQNLVPPHDLAPLVPQWHGASQEPAIFPICPRRKRVSISIGSPLANEARHVRTCASRSSGWTAARHPEPRASSTERPEYSANRAP